MGRLDAFARTFVPRMQKLTLSIHDYLCLCTGSPYQPRQPVSKLPSRPKSQGLGYWHPQQVSAPPQGLDFTPEISLGWGWGWGWGHVINPLDDLFNAGRRERGGNWWPQWLDFLCRGGWSMRPAGFDPFPPLPPRASRLIVPLAPCLSSLSASCLPPAPFPPRASQSPNQSAGSPSTPPVLRA